MHDTQGEQSNFDAATSHIKNQWIAKAVDVSANLEKDGVFVGHGKA